ncbi:MAG: LacI family DNA-binding transcriptional regulator [Armatimonadetes bacterium]|nr:LacI family DNA-binding transcriptional regulator [Armatimonadota bacterium]
MMIPKAPSKVDETTERLLDLAHELGPSAKMPTVRVLREEWNISHATLDAALARLEERNIVVRRQGSGVYVSPGLRLRNIALLCDPDFFLLHGASPFWGLLIGQIRDLAARNEARLSLHFLLPQTENEPPAPLNAEPVPQPLREKIAGGAVHGLIAIGVEHAVSRWIEAQDVPVVAYAGAANYILGQGDETLVRMGITALAAQGCQQIAPWFFSAKFSESNYAVYKATMTAHGLIPMPPLGHLPEGESDSASGYAAGFDLALRIFGGENPPDSFVCANDMQAQSVLMALYRLGLRPGKDVRVATHTNAGSSALLAWHPDIIRMENNPAELVRYLFETLDALMNGQTPQWLPQGERVPEWRYQINPVLLLPTDTPR